MNKSKIFLVVSLLALPACFQIVTKPKPEGPPPIPEVSSTLIELINTQEKFQLNPSDYSSTSLTHLITLGTPMGLRLNLRMNNLGVALVEALKLSRDRVLLDRLFELIQWSNRREVKGEALTTLGSFSDPNDIGYFSSALLDKDLGIRCAAIEALQTWGQPGAIDLLRTQLRDPWSPLVQLFAARALLVLGDTTALPSLFKLLDNRSWIIRALAARYLGDYANPTDYKILLNAMNRETQNDFAMAEAAIATLKLLARKTSDVVYTPTSSKFNDNKRVKYWYQSDNVIEMEPLVILPPRLYMEDVASITQPINQRLRSLINNRLGERLSRADENDSNYLNLNLLITPTGLALKTRYSNLSLIVAEGLGGTLDEILKLELIGLAEYHSNPVTQATALLALGFTSDGSDLPTISRGLLNPEPIVRFGAMEAALAGHFESAVPDIFTIASNDPIPAFRAFAVQILLRFNHPAAHSMILTLLTDSDWPTRAMAAWYLGRYGENIDYATLMTRLSIEQNPFVKAELVLAAERLAP